MTRYAIGDLQGCFKPLQCLLEQCQFNPKRDQLWLVGDLVNRGPDSLATLEFLINLDKQYPNCLKAVLGNHDLNLIAVYYGFAKLKRKDTVQDILTAKKCDNIIEWLCQLPLLYTDPSGDYTMSHAGIPPIWTLQQAQQYAAEISHVLQKPLLRKKFFANMYGDKPDCWDESLESWPRLRLITNYFTRMRFCNAQGKLDLANKTDQSDDPAFRPWFSFASRKAQHQQLIFGHWAALEGQANANNVFALDTGCVWGGKLTAMNLETQQLISCNC